MGMIKCKECSENISSKAKSCPHCGVKVKKGISIVNIVIMLILFFFAIPFISQCGNKKVINSDSYLSPILTLTKTNVKNMLVLMCEQNSDSTIDISCNDYANVIWDDSIYETCKTVKDDINSVKACAITMIRWKEQE